MIQKKWLTIKLLERIEDDVVIKNILNQAIWYRNSYKITIDHE